MSSMRNAVQRRNHRERAQPLERQKWGLLEKHKDYSLRAKDHNDKRRRLKILKEKAAERNPDEFSFGMLSSGVSKKTGTKVGDRGNRALSDDVVKLLKTQDVGYVRTMLQKVRKERAKAQEGFVLEDDGEVEALTGGASSNARRGAGHTVFVEDREAQRAFAPAAFFGVEDEEDLERTWNRPRKQASASDENDEDMDDDNDNDADGWQLVQSKKAKQQHSSNNDDAELQQRRKERAQRKTREKAHEARRLRVEALARKEQDLAAAVEELEAQRARMGNAVGGVNKNGVKFKVRERKR
ncbi:uncharacterized protein K452DRAFT_219604 [Aplosporella prunicola CBS 121167]|uniref:U3 small nucleolar RNA-associated protein 11 n=1 Tax=Aplosporella prunicola CBS 121167 TaxID=1176127 RepID=A0A6A6BPM3_9PEZI|nr:uncharacterized protein K452DRAFT_219604 [Aplosporella prunicola CBS 121167]KAF2146026.1 hypothetical protein K452DRAFT_219604 [Aplosporella prunicola CBS 121167]